MPRDLVAFPETRADLDEDGRVLMRAAEIIERDGWWQFGGYEDEQEDAACVVVALNRASDYLGLPMFLAWDRLQSLVKRPLTEWNDDPITTKTEVTARLRQAALGPRP